MNRQDYQLGGSGWGGGSTEKEKEGITWTRACKMKGVGWRRRVTGREGAAGWELERSVVSACQGLGRASSAISIGRQPGPVRGGTTGQSFAHHLPLCQAPPPILPYFFPCQSSSRTLTKACNFAGDYGSRLTVSLSSKKNLAIFQDSSHATCFPKFLQHSSIFHTWALLGHMFLHRRFSRNIQCLSC